MMSRSRHSPSQLQHPCAIESSTSKCATFVLLLRLRVTSLYSPAVRPKPYCPVYTKALDALKHRCPHAHQEVSGAICFKAWLIHLQVCELRRDPRAAALTTRSASFILQCADSAGSCAKSQRGASWDFKATYRREFEPSHRPLRGIEFDANVAPATQPEHGSNTSVRKKTAHSFFSRP